MSYSTSTRRQLERPTHLTVSEQTCIRAIHHVICSRHVLPGVEDLLQEVATDLPRLHTTLYSLQRKKLVERSAGLIGLTFQGIQLLEELGLSLRF